MIDPSLNLSRRERFLRVFKYESVDHVPDVEFGYWSDTLRRWHGEGLPKWVDDNYKADIYFNFEAWYWNKVPYHIPFKEFKSKVLWENDRKMIIREGNGIIMLKFKDGRGTSIPKYIDFPVKDWDTWNMFKDRYDLNSISYLENWHELLAKYENRNYPLGIDTGGFFGWARNMMGLENLCKTFYRNPELIKDMFEFRVKMIFKAIEKPVREIKIDFSHWWEDMCYKDGPLISPRLFEKYMVPYYKRITSFLETHGVKIHIVDSDGNIDKLVPLWLKAGINCFFPCEIMSGSDPVYLREKYGKKALFMGGVDKVALIKGKKYIDKELERLKPLIEMGGYIPHVDHRVPPDVSYKNYLYYLKLKRKIIGLI